MPELELLLEELPVPDEQLRVTVQSSAESKQPAARADATPPIPITATVSARNVCMLSPLLGK
jgi:hypothetical protein